MNADFPGKFVFNAIVDPGVTQNFEVKHGDVVIYSKQVTGKFPVDADYGPVKEALAKLA